jgi:NAD kinase
MELISKPREIAMDMRLRLVARINSDIDNQEPVTMQALNEICITKGSSGAMCAYEIYVNGILLTVVSGDGILISTPTGSTAYNLSCGGSIVHNSAKVICLTPICPHSLSFRPIILSHSCEIQIRLHESARLSQAQVTMDGFGSYALKQN